MEVEQEAFARMRDQLSGFDIIHGHTWYAFYYFILAAGPMVLILHIHHGSINWPPYGDKS